MRNSNPAPRSLRKTVRWLPLAGMPALMMAMTLPSCPGQEAMQKKMDALQADNARLGNQVASLDAQIRTFSSDDASLKQQMQQMAQAMDAQKATLDQLGNSLKELNQKVAVAAARTQKGSRFKRRRPR